MGKNLIFVSCGQQSDDEKSLGVAIKKEVDATPGFAGYFAQSVHELEAPAPHIFNALQRCAGAVVLLHDRGSFVDRAGKESGRRSSMWVNQEVAVLAYRQFFESRRVPVLCL